MSVSYRILLCVGILLIDLIVFFLPLTALFLAYIVLYNPPFNARTALIWLMPVGLGAVGIGVLLALMSRARRRQAVVLGAEDQAKLRAILEDE